MLTYEGDKFQGPTAIIGKLTSLKFQKVGHVIKAVDFQPTPGNGILVFVTGDLKVDDDANALKFAQAFHLMPSDNTGKNFFVFNDIF